MEKHDQMCWHFLFAHLSITAYLTAKLHKVADCYIKSKRGNEWNCFIFYFILFFLLQSKKQRKISWTLKSFLNLT